MSLTQAGCVARRTRLFQHIDEDVSWVVISDPQHLVYFANFVASPFVFNSQEAPAFLLLGRGGEAVLFADNAQQPFIDRSHVTEAVVPLWYDCTTSAGPRRGLVVEAVRERIAHGPRARYGYEAATCPAPLAAAFAERGGSAAPMNVDATVRALRRTKDSDELAVIESCMRAGTAAMNAVRRTIRPGLTEVEAYALVASEAMRAAGRQVLVYGDFASGPRTGDGGGPPTLRVIERGDLVLLDFSVVIDGYRSDFTSTFVCDAAPTALQREVFDLCHKALAVGEQQLRPGVRCAEVFETVRVALAVPPATFRFPHHAGHGLGLGHPEAPFLVPGSTEELTPGDVITLEPGLYSREKTIGVRLERNYIVQPHGVVCVSNHLIQLEP